MNTLPFFDSSTALHRRDFIRGAASAAIGTQIAAASPDSKPSHGTLRAGDLTAVIGDNSAQGEHRAGYNGVWSLRHAKGSRSLFVPAVAGLNLEHIVSGEFLEDSKTFVEPRSAPMHLTRIGDTEAELHQPPTPTFHVESWTRFRLVTPHYLDMDFRCRAHRDVFPRGYLSLFWASYMNAPADKSMYFLGGLDAQKDMWTQFCTQWHNDQSTVRHREDHFAMTFPEGGRDTLFKSLSRFRFDQPFFYGHFDDLTWIVMFPTRHCHTSLEFGFSTEKGLRRTYGQSPGIRGPETPGPPECAANYGFPRGLRPPFHVSGFGESAGQYPPGLSFHLFPHNPEMIRHSEAVRFKSGW